MKPEGWQNAGSATRWRVFLLTLCALTVLLTAADLYIFAAPNTASVGLVVSPGSKPYLRNVAAVRFGFPAWRAGVRQGDTLDLRPMTPADRYRLQNVKFRGETLALYVVRGATVSKRVVRSAPVALFSWDIWFGLIGAFWMLSFAALLAYRRPDDRDARTLALLLIGLTLAQTLAPNNWVTPWPALDAFAAICSFAVLISYALLATYSNSFAKPPSFLRRVLFWCSYGVAGAVACLGTIWVLVQWTAGFGAWMFLAPRLSFITAIPLIAPLLCATVTLVRTRHTERTRFVWAFVPLALLYAIAIVNGAAEAFTSFGGITNALDNVAAFLAPLGLTYSLLNRRLLDIGFALNRAAIFSGVSIVLVGTFVLVEWLISDWMRLESHSANIMVSGALALALGLSIRVVHGKVEHFVDNFIFRKRREDVEAVHTMAREAPYITDVQTLLARASDTLKHHADAHSVQFLLADGAGHYGSIDENDRVLVALRAQHVPLDLHTMKSAIGGEWAYPMVARGRLIGVLVLGPKRSLEAYAPDESAAIAQLAHSVASAIDVLSFKRETSQDSVLEAVRSLSEHVLALPDAITARLRDFDAER